MKLKQLLNIKKNNQEVLNLSNEDFKRSNFEGSDFRGSDFTNIKALKIYINDKEINLEKMLAEQANNYLMEKSNVWKSKTIGKKLNFF